MITRVPRILTLGLLAIAVSAASSHSAEVDWIGPNLLSNPGFEIAGKQGLPVDWTVTAIPAGTAKFSLDRQVFLTGKAALKAEVPDTGAASVRSKPASVEGGKWYLVSVGYRTTGFGEPGKYSGVDSYVAVTWNDAAGKQIGSAPGSASPTIPSTGIWATVLSWLPPGPPRSSSPPTSTITPRGRSARTSPPRCGWTDGRFAATTRRPRRSGPCKRSRGLSKAA